MGAISAEEMRDLAAMLDKLVPDPAARHVFEGEGLEAAA